MENHKPDKALYFSQKSRFILIFVTCYTINNIWRWKTISCHGIRLVFLPFVNFTSCDLFFFYIFSASFPVLTYLFCSILATLSAFLILFFSSLFFFSFTLACIISIHLSDVITDGICSTDFFRFSLVVYFSGQTNVVSKTSATDFLRIFI